MSDIAAYMTELPGEWEDWYAWHPVSTVDKKVVWLKQLEKRQIFYFIRDLKGNVVWEHTVLEYRIKQQ